MIVDFKTRLFLRPAIRAADVRQQIELEVRRSLEKAANFCDVFM